MLHNVPVQVNLADILHGHQVKVNEIMLRVNARCYRHNYTVGECVMKRRFGYIKLEDRWYSPYKICQVHCNGNVTIEPFSKIAEKISIHRVSPYREPLPANLRQARP